MDFHTRWKLCLIQCIIYCYFVSVLAKDEYGSWHKTLAPFQAHACDDDELNLRCSANTVISVHYVYYGRRANTEHLCSAPDQRLFDPSKSCDSPKALQVIHERCHKHMLCRLHVSPETFREDPCRGIRKYVEVMYKCRPETFLNRVVCEGDHLNLTCPRGLGLTIFSASYGTAGEGVDECRRQDEGGKSKDCLIDHADETVRSLCSGKERCFLKAEDRMFGNPGCKHGKYLKVAYNCVEKELLLPLTNQRILEESIRTTSFPAWAREVDQSAKDSLWPRNHAATPTRSSSSSSQLGMQSDEVPTEDRYELGDQRLVGFMSKLLSAHKYMSGNTAKLILYVSISLVVGFLVFLTVLAGSCVIKRLDVRCSKKMDIVHNVEEQFFSDSDLEQFDPAESLPPPPLPQFTNSMKRLNSDTCPRAPLNRGSEHYFT